MSRKGKSVEKEVDKWLPEATGTKGEHLQMGTRNLFGAMKIFKNWFVVVVAQFLNLVN